MFWHLRARVIPILTLIMDILLFSLLAPTVNSLASVLISSPFDNFRIECPQSSGAQRLAIRMVESQGQKRQDTVFVLNCQHIVELYPWLAMPDDIAEREREDCHYTQQFDPLLDRDIPWTCRPREYLAGIARLSDTRIQLECCRLRSRDEAGCVELEYEKPIGSGARVEIEYQAKLINAISIDGDVIRVRFCDLSPRQIEDIVADAGTTPRPTVPPPPPPARPLTTVVTPFRSSSGGQAAGAEPMLLNDPRKIVKQSPHKFSANPPPNINTDWQNGPPAELAQVDEEMQPGDGQQRVVAHGVNLQQEVQEPNGQSQVGAVQPADQPKAEEETQTTQSIEQQQTAQSTSKQELGQQPMPVEAEQDKEQVQPEATHQQIEQQQQMETQTVQPERQSEPQPQIETSTSAISVEMPTKAGETTATDPNQQQIMREAETTADQPAVHTIQFGNEEKEKMPMNDIGRDADLIKNESTADREGPRIKIHGLNFRTIQFGQNVQKVRAPEQEQEFAKQQESINGQIDGKERGKEEKPAADQREGNGRERMEEENNTSPPGDGRLNVEEQQEKAMENGQKDQQTSEPDQQQQTQTEPETSTTTTATTTTSAAAAEPKPTTISSSSAAKIKSNLLLRRRGMHDFTITLMPPRVGEPVGPGIGADRQRQAAELAIQKQVDAIRAVEKQIQMVKAEAGEKASEGAEEAKEERKQESVGKGDGRETKEGAEQQQESERRLDQEKEMTEKKTANSIGQAVGDRKNETINEKEEKGFWVPSPNPPDPGFWVPQPMPDKHQTMEGKQEVVEPASREEAQKTTQTNGSDKEEKTEKQDQQEDSDQRRKSNETKSDDNSSDQQRRSDLTDLNPIGGSTDQAEKTTTLVPNDGEAMHRILFGEPAETETSTKKTTNQDQEEQTTPQPQIKPISEEKPLAPKKKKPIQIRKLGQSETGEVHTIQLPGTPLRTIISEQQKQEQKDLDEQPQQKHQQMEVSSRTSEAKASKTGKQEEVQFEAPNSSADQLDQWGVGNDQRKIKDAELPESLYSSTEPSEQQQQQSDGPEAQKKQEKPSDSASGKINDQLDPEVGLKSSDAPFSVINDSEGGQNSTGAIKEQQGGEEKPSVDQKTTTNSTMNAEQNSGRQMDDKGSKKRLRIFSINLERTQTTNPTPIASSTASSSPTTESNDKEEESEGEKPNDQQEVNGKDREREEMKKKQQQSQRQQQQQQEVGGGFVAENEAQIKAIRKGLPIYSIDYLKQKHQQPVLGTLSSHAPRSSSEEVKAADQSVETMFPLQMEKELENVREASAELLHSLAGMMEHRQKARKIMDKVRQSTGIGRGEQPAPPSSREFADTMFREIEAQERSAKEMLSQLSTAITTRGPSVTEAEEATTIGIGTSHSSANISQTPVEATFTSPQPLANLSFSEDSQVEDISVERQPKAEAEADDGGKLERRTIGGGMEKEMLTNENSSNSTVAMEEKSEWLGNSTLATKMEAETDMKKPEDDEDEEYEDEEEEKEADLDGGGKNRTECDNNNSTENAGDRTRECAEGKQPTKTTTASSSAAAAKEQAMITADQKGKEEKEADDQKEEREGEDEKTRLAQNNLAAKAKAAKTVEGPLAAEGKELRRTEAKHSGGAKARKAKAKKKQEEEEATKAEDVEELPTTEAPLAAADLPPLDAFPTPPPSSPSSGRGRLPPAPPPSQLPQLPAREEEQKRKKPNGQQQFGALTLTGQQSRAVMREGIDFEVAEEREQGISTAAGGGKGKAEKEGKEEKDEKEGKEREDEVTTSSQSTTVTTKSRRPAATTTRVPLYKRRQLDRIALQVFGPAAFDPTEPRVPVDQQQEQPRRVIPARRPRPRHPQPPATSPAPSGPGATGLPDEETDTSPFDAERAQLLQRLRQRHRPGTNAGGGDWAPTSAARGSEENDENADGGAFDPSSAEQRAKQQQPSHSEPAAAVDRPRLRGRFDRVHLGGRFEKEPSSPFDRSEGREKAGEIRRKPIVPTFGIAAASAANFADSDIEKQPLALVEEAAQKMHRDGTPIFSPKDNQPMKMPKTEPRQRIVGKKEESIQQQEGKSNNEVKEVEAEKGVDQDILVPMSGGGENIKMDEHLRQQIEEDATTVTSAKTLEMETTTATTEPATPSLEDKMPADKIQQPQKPRHSPKSTTKAPEQYWAFWTSGSNGPTVEGAATTSASPFYNAHKYFRMPSRRRGHQSRERENVLTFCSKSAALRDSSNLPIACAGEDGQVWSPPRCPPGTGCLAAADSAFYICCPVNGSRR